MKRLAVATAILGAVVAALIPSADARRPRGRRSWAVLVSGRAHLPPVPRATETTITTTEPVSPTAPAPTTSPTTTTSAPLPARTSAELREYAVGLTRDPVAEGSVRIDVANIGQDDHDFAIARGDGTILAQTAVVAPKGEATLHVDLAAGDYKVYCTLYDGAHDAAGMHATLHVR